MTTKRDLLTEAPAGFHYHTNPRRSRSAAGPGDWCRHHPDAPKPVYEAMVEAEGFTPAPATGWEPVSYEFAPQLPSWQGRPAILWRRITGYTGGDNE